MVATCHHNVVPKRDVGIRKAQQRGACFGFVLLISRFGARSVCCRVLLASCSSLLLTQPFSRLVDIIGLGLLNNLARFFVLGALVHVVVGTGLNLVSDICYRRGHHEPRRW